MPTPSPTTDLADLVALVRGLVERDEADGVVVTHGTNTLEETAWLLHLVVPGDAAGGRDRRDAPGVGAVGRRPAQPRQRRAGCGDPSAARGLGALVLLDDTIHGARDVTKSDTMRVSAFRDGASGPLGWVDGDGRVVARPRPAAGRLAPRPVRRRRPAGACRVSTS